MMKILLAATALTAAMATAPAMAGTITPVAITASNTIDLFGNYKPENLINGSGLQGGLHDGDYTNMWMTEQTLQSATLVFDLGASYALGAVNIWNYNTDFGMGYSLARGARDFVLSLSQDGINYAQILASTLEKGTGLPLPAQTYAFSGTARYVRLDLLNNYGDQWTAVGLSEVNFTAVPEPATLAVLGLGLVGMAAARRRKA